VWSLVKETAASWVAHKDARLGAALAYYSIFSLGPLIVIVISVAGVLFGEDAVRGEVSAQVQGLLGNSGAQAIQSMLVGASRPRRDICGRVRYRDVDFCRPGRCGAADRMLAANQCPRWVDDVEKVLFHR